MDKTHIDGSYVPSENNYTASIQSFMEDQTLRRIYFHPYSGFKVILKGLVFISMFYLLPCAVVLHRAALFLLVSPPVLQAPTSCQVPCVHSHMERSSATRPALSSLAQCLWLTVARANEEGESEALMHISGSRWGAGKYWGSCTQVYYIHP